MDEDWHVQQLQCHCRVCGSRIIKSGAGYASREYDFTSLATEIKATCASTQHTHMCRQCYNALQKRRLAIKAGNTTVHSVSLLDWEAHSDSCQVNKYTVYKTQH